jgi:ubiquitin carboxyl-terminal hydrolase 34
MCPSDSTHQAHSSMTESSRTRSDSLEASSSQQERKRPRLDSGPNNSLRSDEALTDSGMPENSPDSYSLTSVPTDGPRFTNSPSPSSLNMATSSNGPLSKVTINTRSAANTANHVNEPTTNSGDRPENRSTTQISPVIASATPLSSVDEPEMVAVPQDIIAIHSSPSQSPEIQIAIVEDIDQDPADTNWTPVTRLADSARLQAQATPHYVSRTFPYARRTPAGFTHDILTQISKTFVQGPPTILINVLLANVFLRWRERRNPFH